MAAFLQDFILSQTFAHPKVFQGGEGKTSHLLPHFSISKQNPYQTSHVRENQSVLVVCRIGDCANQWEVDKTNEERWDG